MYLYSRNSKYQRIKESLKNHKIFQFGIYIENYKDFKDNISRNIPDDQFAYTITHHKINYKYMNNFYTLDYNGSTFMHIFVTNSCISYNDIVYRKQKYKVLSIDSILSLYFGLIVADHETFNLQNLYIFCFILYSIIQNKYEIQSPLLKRFNLPCIGTHETFEDIKKNRTKKFNELKKNKKSKEYQEWFLQYVPSKTTKLSKTLKLSKSKSKNT